MKNSFLFLLSVIVIFSCSEKKHADSHQQLMDGVMAAHDVVMPKMGDIMKYKKQIDEKVQELQVAGAEANQEAITKLQHVAAGLDSTHDQMMTWMHEFNTDFNNMTEEDIVNYLNEQKVKIERVGQLTDAYLKEAVEILQQ